MIQITTTKQVSYHEAHETPFRVSSYQYMRSLPMRTDLVNQFSCLFNPCRLVIVQNTAGAVRSQR